MPPGFGTFDSAARLPLPANMDEVGEANAWPALASSPPVGPHYCAPPSPTSSEPPLFSSDGPLEAEAVENYESPHLKRKRTGRWWDFTSLGPAVGTVKKKKKLTRNFDSGVFMPSDSSDMSSSYDYEAALKTNSQDYSRSSLSYASSQMLQLLSKLVETNEQSYDFDSMGLEDEDILHISMLNQVIPKPTGYNNLVPELKVSFRRNGLCRLVPAVFSVENLTTLNLRNNRLVELSPLFAKLERLETLDVSFNYLKWFPKEVLDLMTNGALRRIIFFGNTLLGHQLRDAIGHERQLRARARMPLTSLTPLTHPSHIWLYKLVQTLLYCKTMEAVVKKNGTRGVTLIATSRASYFDELGHVLKGSTEPILHDTAWPDVAIKIAHDDSTVTTYRSATYDEGDWFVPPSRSRVPSLSRLAFQQCIQTMGIAELRDYFRFEDVTIPGIESQLSQAEEQSKTNYQPLRSCSVCRKPFNFPRAEWVEYYDCEKDQMLPIKHYACSWGCVPTSIAEKPDGEVM